MDGALLWLAGTAALAVLGLYSARRWLDRQHDRSSTDAERRRWREHGPP